MSDWLVHLVRLGKIGKHPNADNLDITTVYGQAVICQRGLYEPGDLAVFLPPESVLPMDPSCPLVKDSGLNPGHVIEAKRLRGIFSNGMLVPAKLVFTRSELVNLTVGTHVAHLLGVTKYESAGDQQAVAGGDNERDTGYMPVYTDIEGWPKHRDEGIIKKGDEIVLTEKIHGCNARFTFRDNRLWCGSHTNVKAQNVFTTPDGRQFEKNLWWKVAKEIDLEGKFRKLQSTAIMDLTDKHLLRDLSKTVVYGEVYGQVQNLKYGIEKGAALRVFDTFDGSRGTYNDWNTTVAIANAMGLDLVPELYRGPWKEDLEELRNGPSVLYPGHIREGFVIKPVVESFDEYLGRVIFKFVGEDYKTRKRK